MTFTNGWELTIHPAKLQTRMEANLKQLEEGNFLNRLWAYDHTLWQDSPTQISNRLDWLHLHETMQPKIQELEDFTQTILDEGYSTVVLLGMGGSSLAPDVFGKIFGTREGFLELIVLDTTDPAAIGAAEERLDLAKTFFLVATKSGSTVETLSLFKYFYNRTVEQLGEAQAGQHFAAITDPGSKLDRLASQLHFRQAFLNNTDVGGRFSAMSYFGLVPAALIGVDLSKMLASSGTAADANWPGKSPADAPAVQLGALLGVAVSAGRDKLTFLADQQMIPFSDWIEQLIAESTGKSGTGILPVVGEIPPKDLDTYSPDRIFVLQQIGSSEALNVLSERFRALDFPVIEFKAADAYGLGALILTWEIATAVAGHLMEIHPFNQPNVESAKVLARKSVQAYRDTGELPAREAAKLSEEAIEAFLSEVKPGDYISLQAYLRPTDEIEAEFRKMQARLRDKHRCAVTFGFGPRFLHSTGQLHKGDRGNGHFIQFVTTTPQDLEIPDNPGEPESGITFSALKQAQAIGDADALREADRPVLTFILEDDPLAAIQGMVSDL